MSAHIIESAPIVDAMVDDQRARLAALPAEAPFEPGLAVVATLPEDKPTLSYLHRMAIHATAVGIEFHDYYTRGNEDAALANITRLNDQDGSATMVMMPLSDTSREQEVRALISPHRDPDALSWKYDKASDTYADGHPNFPATPLSVLRLAEQAMGAPLEELIARGDLDPERVVFYGLGALVNRPAQEILNRRLAEMGVTGAEFMVISRENNNTHLIEELGDRADIVLAAAGSTAAAGALKAGYLRRPTGSRRESLAVIDAAVCTGADGRPYGNVNPDVYDPGLDFTVKVTPYDAKRGPIKGVGPLTAAYLIDHTIQTVERDAAPFAAVART